MLLQSHANGQGKAMVTYTDMAFESLAWKLPHNKEKEIFIRIDTIYGPLLLLAKIIPLLVEYCSYT